MAVKTRATFKTDKNAAIVVGVPNNITAQEMRDLFDDLVDSVVMPEDPTYSTAVTKANTALQPAAIGSTVAQAPIITTTDPTVNDDSTDGHLVGRLWINTTAGTEFTFKGGGSGAGQWLKKVISAVPMATEAYVSAAIAGQGLGSMAFTQASDYSTTNNLPVNRFNAGGDPSAARPGSIPLTTALIWTNTNGVKPTNMIDGLDIYIGGEDGVVPGITITTAGYTLALTDVGSLIGIDYTSNVTITVPNNASVPFTTRTQISFLVQNTGDLIIQGDTGVSINGSSGGSLTASEQWSMVLLTKIGTNSWSARLIQNAGSGGLTVPVPNNQTGTSYTVTTADAFGLITRNNASANATTFDATTLASAPLGTSWKVTRTGAGASTVQVTGGTLNGLSNGTTTISGQNGASESGTVTVTKLTSTAFIIEGRFGTVTAAGATITYPTAIGTLTDLGSDWLIELAPGSGNLVVFGATITGARSVLIAGGGSGAALTSSFPDLRLGGGGGAGDLIHNSSFSWAPGTYAFTVGAGGASQTGNGVGNAGSNSTFNGSTAVGGGRGGYDGTAGGSGGSGGGAGYASSGGGSATGLGFAGGNGRNTGVAETSGGGGGGGMGGAGGNATLDGAGSMGGAGGAGVANDITGASLTYSAGGRGDGLTLPSVPTGASNYGSGTDAVSGTASAAGQNGRLFVRVPKAQVSSITGV